MVHSAIILLVKRKDFVSANTSWTRVVGFDKLSQRPVGLVAELAEASLSKPRAAPSQAQRFFALTRF
ncbi:MAG: hypothetical protein EI684_23205 [Candidatus Viridilinea halotolerans]|uniref:Uncharacterized protein n=1 Tax=Candidatus Viridilinea halotolerans TaxID=2491704 RepID=A0A426TQC2_9CHLR|nr:MAG: hypothetical protein EI684_23205 [Candidatus Viridilinea halotolerans]